MSEGHAGWRYVSKEPSITLVAAVPDRQQADHAVGRAYPNATFETVEPLNQIELVDYGVPLGEVYRIP